ncbi:MAG: hypothetical protein J6S89_09875, partial [Paludibacteraceae bacterium]|nr:hypothetical protein [Paludibacteraceae bacterium]
IQTRVILLNISKITHFLQTNKRRSFLVTTSFSKKKRGQPDFLVTLFSLYYPPSGQQPVHFVGMPVLRYDGFKSVLL